MTNAKTNKKPEGAAPVAPKAKPVPKVYSPAISRFLSTIQNPNRDLDACDLSGKVRVHRFEAVVEEETNVILLARIPSGHTLFLGQMSLLETDGCPEKLTFDIGHGQYTEPMGERHEANHQAFVSERKLEALQTLRGPLTYIKLRAVSQLDVVMQTSKPLPVGAAVRGYIAYSHD